jgi:fibronectin type 3 domain-containing protein
MRRLLSLLACLVTTLFVVTPAVQLLSTPAANAVEDGSLSAQISSSWQANATVWKLAYAKNDVFIVGDFTSLRPPGDPAGTGEVPATYFAALNDNTGAMDPAIATHSFTGQPAGTLPLTNGIVAASPDGSVVYVGGTFTKVDGVTRNHIAAFNSSTGALITSWHPSFNGQVNAIAQVGNTVYVGGTFTTAAGTTVSNLAAINATNGAALAWGATTPTTDDTVDALAVTPDGSQVVIGGYFDTVDGLSKSADGLTPYNKAAIIGGVGSAQAGQLEPMTGDTVVPVGTAAHNPNGCISNVKDVVISGSAAYIADEGTGGGCFDGTWSVNLPDGSLKWVNRCLGATQAVQVVGNFLYKGSHQHDCVSQNTNGDPNNFPQVPANHNRHLTSEFLNNGFLGPWNPDMNAGPNLGPRGMATDGSQLWVGGDFTVINNVNQQGIARFTATTDYPTPRPSPAIAVPAGPGAVNIFSQAPVDPDDPDLTLELFRDGGTTPIATTNVNSLFWKDPVVGFTDTGLVVGSTHTYKVEAFETFGTGHSPLSGISNVVTVGNGSSGYAATVLNQNPVGYWRFGEPAGSGIAADASPSLNGGVYTGGVTLGQPGAIIGDPDTAMTLDGSTGYFSSGVPQPSPTTFTVEAWFNTTTTSGGKIIGFGNAQTGNSSSYDKHVYMTNAGKLIFGTYNGGTQTITSANSYNDGKWHQVVASQGPSGMSLYVDGVKIGSNPATVNQSYTGYWRVGQDNLGSWPSAPSSTFFAGSIDEASVYNTVLTPAQVVAQYTAAGYTVPPPPGSTTPYAKNVIADAPSLYWRLDESSGLTALDISGNGDNGTYGSGDSKPVSGAITDGTSPADTAITLSGNNNGVMVGQSQLPSPTAFTIETWFKTTHASGKLVGFGNASTATGSTSYDKHIYFSGNNLNFGVYTGVENIISTSALPLINNQWHHVVATQDASGMKLYVDGQLKASSPVNTNQAYNGYWHVGGDTGWGTVANYTGSLDEVAIYPYALSANQVLSDYQIGTGQTTTPNPPPAPAQPTVTATSSTATTVSWTPVAGATSYTVQRSVSGANSFINVGTNLVTPTFNDSNLTPGASYDYVVIATNAGGNSAPSPIKTITLPPGQPGPLSASANGPNEIDLSWTPAPGATSYDVQRGAGGSGTFTTDLGTVTNTSFADTGHNPGDSFDYEVIPQSAGGSGTASNIATGTTTPAQVSGLSANPVSASEVDLSWSSAAGAATYLVQRAPSGTSNWTTVSQGGSGTSFADTSVSAGTSYDYQVAGVDAGGTGAFSGTQTATTIPGQPGTLSATANGTNEIDLNWSTAAGATSYDVKRGPGGSGNFTTDLGSVTNTSFADTGLNPGDSFDYEVIPSDSTGPGPASNTATGTTLPVQVTGLSANASSATEVDLSWNNAAGASTYVVQRAPSGTTNWTTVGSGSSSLTFADTSVASGTSYDYQVAAVNAGGTGAFSGTQTVTTPLVKPGQVTGLQANAVTPTEVDLLWNSTSGATGYEVDRSSVSASTGFAPIATGLTSASYQDKSASPQNTYWYEVIASNSAGNGPASAAATATTGAVNVPLLSNNFEGGSNGTAITAANSGGTSGNAFNTASCTSGTETFSNASPAHGNLFGLLSPTTNLCYLQWNNKSVSPTTASYGRAYLKLAANPAGAFGLMRITDASSVRDVQVNLSKTGKLSVLDANGTTQVTFTQSVPLNQWVRLEWHVVSAASGTFELRMYSGDSTTPLETHVLTGIPTGTVIGGVQVGALSTVAGGLGTTIGVDDLAYGTNTWFGPAS